MHDDPKTLPDDETDKTPPLIPDLDDAKKPAENVEEKGEPFDSNFA